MRGQGGWNADNDIAIYQLKLLLLRSCILQTRREWWGKALIVFIFSLGKTFAEEEKKEEESKGWVKGKLMSAAPK